MKKGMEACIMVAVRLGEELDQRLSLLASRMKRAKSTLIREAIAEKLEEWEDIANALEALRDPGRMWTLDELIEGHDAGQDALDS